MYVCTHIEELVGTKATSQLKDAAASGSCDGHAKFDVILRNVRKAVSLERVLEEGEHALYRFKNIDGSASVSFTILFSK